MIISQYKYTNYRDQDYSPIILLFSEVSTTKMIWIGQKGLTRSKSVNIQPSIDYDIEIKHTGELVHRAKIIGVDLI